MSDSATPARLFIPTARGLLAAVNLSAVPHQPVPSGEHIPQTPALPRPFLASSEDGPLPETATDLAIVINPDGEVTVCEFYEAATPDRLWGQWGNICRLLDTPQPISITLPRFPSLLAWIDGRGEVCGRDVNTIASTLVQVQCSAPTTLVHGPLLLTGGMPRRPVALEGAQVIEALEDVLGIDLDDEDDFFF